MIIRAMRHVGDPHPIVAQDVRVLVLEDDKGTPLFVACEWERGSFTLCNADDPDFNKVLQNLGINKLTICDRLDGGPRNLNALREMPLLLRGRQ